MRGGRGYAVILPGASARTVQPEYRRVIHKAAEVCPFRMSCQSPSRTRLQEPVFRVESSRLWSLQRNIDDVEELGLTAVFIPTFARQQFSRGPVADRTDPWATSVRNPLFSGDATLSHFAGIGKAHDALNYNHHCTYTYNNIPAGLRGRKRRRRNAQSRRVANCALIKNMRASDSALQKPIHAAKRHARKARPAQAGWHGYPTNFLCC